MRTLIKPLPAILIWICPLLTPEAHAQNHPAPTPVTSKPSIGISAGHYRYDPGVAIEYTTRGVFQNHLSLRIKGGIQWLEDYKAIHNQWVRYHTFSAGLVYNGQLFDRARFFAELGLIGISPNARFSDSGFVQGIYQFNGVEINLLRKDNYTMCLFLGAGPAFIKASAEKIEGSPRYGHGIHFINGVRVYIGE